LSRGNNPSLNAVSLCNVRIRHAQQCKGYRGGTDPTKAAAGDGSAVPRIEAIETTTNRYYDSMKMGLPEANNAKPILWYGFGAESGI